MQQCSQTQVLLQVSVHNLNTKDSILIQWTGGSEGHLARECPDAPAAPGGGSGGGWGGMSGGGGGGYSGGGYGGGSERECYRCGGRGHIAR